MRFWLATNQLPSRLQELDTQGQALRHLQWRHRELGKLMLPSAATLLVQVFRCLYWFLTQHLSLIRCYAKLGTLACCRRVYLLRIRLNAYAPENTQRKGLSNAEKVDAHSTLHEPVNPCQTLQKSALSNCGNTKKACFSKPATKPAKGHLEGGSLWVF